MHHDSFFWHSICVYDCPWKNGWKDLMTPEDEKGRLFARIQARREEIDRLIAATKITRDSPGLFIEETLFTCLARFCRAFKGVFERHEDLFKPVASQFDHDDLTRLVDKCTDEAIRADLAKTYSDTRPEAVLTALWTNPASNELFRECFATWLSDKAKEVRDWQAERPDPMAVRFGELCRLFKLTQVERDALAMAVMAKQKYGGIEQISGRLGPCGMGIRAALLGVSQEEYTRLLEPKGRLRRFGCLKKDGNLGDDMWLYLLGVDDAPLTGRFFRKCEDPSLPWAYFGELASRHGELLKRMISCASSQRGVNILLYGEPGTGKSSFARALARELGRDAYLITQSDKERGSMSASTRFAALRVCDGQVPPETSLIIVDESDAMLEGEGGGLFLHPFINSGNKDKGTLNDVLDEIRAPCIWITNSRADSLDSSNRRRFDYSIRFDKLTREQQTAVWRNAAQRYGVGDALPEELLARMAGRYAVSAGGIDLALRNLSAMMAKNAVRQEDAEAILATLLDAHVSLLGGPDSARPRECAGYSLDGLNIKGPIVLSRIESAVRRFKETRFRSSDAAPDSPRMNLLLYGPPGSGKTAFIHYLGASLNLRVVTKTGSDLLGMYVGETEKNIRNAFREAGRESSILFLDEIDGLLRTRAGAERGWEVSQVNEILRQMEEFGGVLACATNFADNLDAAALRRFTFKLEFGFLTEDGKLTFYRRMFASLAAGELTPEDERRLLNIPDLTPGDFRTVRQEFHYLDDNATHELLLDALERESAAKRGFRINNRIVGFASVHE
ncbi:MAG: ATP-binding protein [Kiritimatiellae bacterium]|nr:ATP-binding protein [Kiritimatiellia bacterium]